MYQMLLQTCNPNYNCFQSDTCYTSQKQQRTGTEEHSCQHRANWHRFGSLSYTNWSDFKQNSLATAGHSHNMPLGVFVNPEV